MLNKVCSTTLLILISIGTYSQGTALIWSDDFSGSKTWNVAADSGSAPWQIGNSGLLSMGTFGSSTSTNGYAFIDCNHSGPGGITNSYIESEWISLDGTKSIIIQFEQMYKKLNDKVYVGIRQGSVWTDVEANPLFLSLDSTNNPELYQINFTEYLLDFDSLKLRFKFYGGWDFGWAVDDVKVYQGYDSDLGTHEMVWGVNQNNGFYSDIYSHLPYSQSNSLFFNNSIKIINKGSDDLSNFSCNVDIQGPSSFNTIVSIPDIASGQYQWINVLDSQQYNNHGLYTTVFEIDSDDNNDNNMIQSFILVNDSVYAWDNGIADSRIQCESGSMTLNQFDFATEDTLNSISFFVHAYSDTGSKFIPIVLNEIDSLVLTGDTFSVQMDDLNTWKTVSISGYLPVGKLRVGFSILSGNLFVGANRMLLNSGQTQQYVNQQIDLPSRLAFIRANVRSCGGISTSVQAGEVVSGADGFVDANVSGGNSPYNYLWSTGESTASISQLNEGYYSLTVTDANGCVSGSGVFVNVTSTNFPNPIENEILFFPNPATSVLNFNSAPEMVKIFNIDGRIISSFENPGSHLELGKYISSGTYLISINVEGHPIINDVLIVK